MNDNSVSEVLKRIDKAMDVAGEGAKYAWPKLIDYTRFKAIGEIFSFIVIIFVFSLLAYFIQKKLDWNDWEEHPVYVIITISFGLIALLLFVIGVIEFSGRMATVISPEAYIILKTIGK